MIATKQTTRPAVLAGRLERDRLLSYLGLALALAVAAGLNLWNLIYQSGGTQLLLTPTGDLRKGYTAAISIALDLSDTKIGASDSNAHKGGGAGGPPPGGGQGSVPAP